MDEPNQAVKSKERPPFPDLAKLQGNYSFHLSGTAPIFNSGWIPPNQVGFPWKLLAGVGIMNFDGQGNVRAAAAFNHNGVLIAPPPTQLPNMPNGMYTVTMLNTGTINIETQNQIFYRVTLFFTMARNWDELFLLWIDPARNPSYPRPNSGNPSFSTGYGENLISPIWNSPLGLIPPPFPPAPAGAVVTGIAKRVESL